MLDFIQYLVFTFFKNSGRFLGQYFWWRFEQLFWFFGWIFWAFFDEFLEKFLTIVNHLIFYDMYLNLYKEISYEVQKLNCDFRIILAPIFECVSGNHRSMYLEQSGRFIFGTFSGAVSCPNFVCSLVWVQKMKTNNSWSNWHRKVTT